MTYFCNLNVCWFAYTFLFYFIIMKFITFSKSLVILLPFSLKSPTPFYFSMLLLVLDLLLLESKSFSSISLMSLSLAYVDTILCFFTFFHSDGLLINSSWKLLMSYVLFLIVSSLYILFSNRYLFST